MCTVVIITFLYEDEFFKGGKAVHTMIGSMPKADLVKELEANL